MGWSWTRGGRLALAGVVLVPVALAVLLATAGGDDGSADPSAVAAQRTRWNTFYGRWLEPATDVVLPFIAMLAVLLVLARLLTPVAVPAKAVAWPERPRQIAWWLGVLLLGAVACGFAAPAAATPLFGWVAPASTRLLFPALVVAVAGAVLWCARHWDLVTQGEGDPRSRGGSRRRGLRLAGVLAVLVVVVGLVVGVAAVLLDRTIPEAAWPWVWGCALGLLGVVLVAGGRGHALRLQITVKKGADTDAAASSYVLARLQDLGTSAPRGLKAAQQVDVTQLPADALSGLPAGKVATVLAPLLGLLLPSVPWRATVEVSDEDKAVVTVTRNGAAAGTAVVDGARFRPAIVAGVRRAREAAVTEEEGDEEAPQVVDVTDLLTAAAAVVLTELARPHRSLRPGLCGARRWESVALHVVATKPPESPGGTELRRALLAGAVDVDPDNALARSAYTKLLGEEARTADEFERHAHRLHELLTVIDSQRGVPPATAGSCCECPTGEGATAASPEDDGYTALRARTLHALVATWLNVAAAADGTPAAADAVGRATCRFGQLTAVLGPTYRDAQLARFISQFRAISNELREALVLLRDGAEGLPAPFDLGPGHRDAHSLHVLYDRACRRTRRRAYEEALVDLRMAAGLGELRDMAVRDPWLADLRVPGGATEDQVEEFWLLVGGPPAEYTDLPSFGAKGGALGDLGLRTPRDLLSAASSPDGAAGLATALQVPVRVVDQWTEQARLAVGSRPEHVELTPRELRLLASAGISSPGALLARVDGRDGVGQLLEVLERSAAADGVRPPTTGDLERWVRQAKEGVVPPEEPSAGGRCRLPFRRG